MTITLIKKRSGTLVPFDRVRIEQALEKAYCAVHGCFDTEKIQLITDEVLAMLDTQYPNIEDDETVSHTLPDVELVQNIVEKAILKIGDIDVARAYMIYRQERAELREVEQQETLKKIEESAIRVKKRSGKMVTFDLGEIKKAIENVLKDTNFSIDVDAIVQSAKLNMYDGMTTSEINRAIVMALKATLEREPGMSFVTARFLINDLYKDVLHIDEFTPHFKKVYQEQFSNAIKRGVKEERLDARLEEIFDLHKLSLELKPERDQLFEFMGIQVLYDRYFVRTQKEQIIEVPQYFWMRVAMGIALLEKDPTAVAIDFYHTLSQMLYVPSTPTLLHSGTCHPQMSSCFLSTTEDDLHHIFHSIGNNAQLSKYSGGVANDWTSIRATNAWIKTINTGSQGVIPFLKIVDATTSSINRSGKRRGATAVYLETWHMDIEDFLDLRKNTGDERRRTHDLNTVNWIPDMFMKRVAEGGDWTLFSPEEVPDLHEIYGKKFEDAYTTYEKMADRGEIQLWKRIPAADLWRKMIMMVFETGHPWITFKDPSNIRSPQDHVGVVHSSNLCTEITLNTSKEETAVCNIGSMNLVRHVKNKEMDWALLEKTAQQAMRMLDNVIDISFYPIPEAEHANKKHRPVGLGIMGLQDVFFELGMNFDSDAAVQFSDKLMEYVSYNAILASSYLAEEKGAYSTFKGSKWDRNLFPVDTIALLEKERGMTTGIVPTGLMDWTSVRARVQKFGLRNSNTMAIAPTATIANISGCLPSVEPIYKNLYVKSNFSGEFTIVNEYLVRDLKDRGLWNDVMLDKIKRHDGNLEQITEIPEELRAKYKEAFQIDPHWVITHAAHRGKWIDQSQSINIFMNTSSGRAISDMYMNAWQMGLKTTYYLRSLGATSVEKSTIDLKASTNPESEIVARPKVTIAGEVCESCQ
jgi:ribonucleoside-diphosphate reductase alpha chain